MLWKSENGWGFDEDLVGIFSTEEKARETAGAKLGVNLWIGNMTLDEITPDLKRALEE